MSGEIQIATDYTPLPVAKTKRVSESLPDIARVIKQLERIADRLGDEAPMMLLKISPRDHALIRGSGMKMAAAYARNPNMRKLMKCSIRVENGYFGEPYIAGIEGSERENFDGLKELQFRQDMVRLAHWRERGF